MASTAGSSADTVEVYVLGVGAGQTHTYDNEVSTALLVLVRGQPQLLLDVGGGVVQALKSKGYKIPSNVYISHNHMDHAGDLPIILKVESKNHHNLTVFAEEDVMAILKEHRLHELQSTGQQLENFATFTNLFEGTFGHIVPGLDVVPIRSAHSELCFGLLLYYKGEPIMGWSADCAFDLSVYEELAEAPTLILDARQQGDREHASFEDIESLAHLAAFRGKRLFVVGYGTLESGAKVETDSYHVAKPGLLIQLFPLPHSEESEDDVSSPSGTTKYGRMFLHGWAYV